MIHIKETTVEYAINAMKGKCHFLYQISQTGLIMKSNKTRLSNLLDKRRSKILENLLHEVLIELGEDPSRPGLIKTPQRWADALITYTQGMTQDPEDYLKVIFQLEEDDYPSKSDDMVLLDNIQFVSTCEHHMAPIRGLAHIGYIPNNKSRAITGLSKLARVVSVFANRLQVQEQMTHQIATAIHQHLNPLGVIVVVQAIHYCMIQRGVKQHDSTTLTTARRGVFQSKSELEFK